MLEYISCPNCENILDFEGIDSDSELFRCDYCKIAWIWNIKTNKWIIDDPDRDETRYIGILRLYYDHEEDLIKTKGSILFALAIWTLFWNIVFDIHRIQKK